MARSRVLYYAIPAMLVFTSVMPWNYAVMLLIMLEW